MENTQRNNTALQYVFYNNSCSEYLLDDLDDMYIAMKTQYSALIPRFLCPCQPKRKMKYTYCLYFLREDSSEFYECPSDFFHADRHSVFTRDFDSINVELSTATVYYYGIDTKTYEPKVTTLSYSQADDCFYIDNGIQSGQHKSI